MQIVAKKVLKMENVKAKAHGVIPLVYDIFDASHGLVSNPRRGHSQLALTSASLSLDPSRSTLTPGSSMLLSTSGQPECSCAHDTIWHGKPLSNRLQFRLFTLPAQVLAPIHLSLPAFLS